MILRVYMYATSAWCYQCLMRPVPDVISVWCDQYLMLPVPDVSSTWWLIERVDKAAPFAGRRGLRCSVGHLPASHPASSSPSRSPVVTYSPSRSHVHAAMMIDTRRVTSLVVVDVLQCDFTHLNDVLLAVFAQDGLNCHNVKSTEHFASFVHPQLVPADMTSHRQ